jgi:hypothetical protein
MSQHMFSTGKSAAAIATLIVASATFTFAGPASADPHSAASRPLSVHPVSGVSELAAIACSGRNSCFAVGYVETSTEPYSEGVVVPVVDGNPGSAELVPGTVRLNGIACPSTSTCIAVGDQAVSWMGSNPIFSVGEVVTITNGTPGGAEEAAPGPDPWMGSPNELFLYSVSCTEVSSCVAVGNDDAYNGVVVPIKNGSPGPEKVIGGAEQNLVNGVTCSEDCYAVGSWSTDQYDGADVVTIVHRKPGNFAEYPKRFGFSAIACYGDSDSCMVVGTETTEKSAGGMLLPISDTTDARPMTGVDPAAITCRATTYCVAVGSDSGDGAIVRVTNEIPATAQLVPAVGGLVGVSCFGTADCLAVGSNSSGPMIVKFTLPS